MKKNKFSFVAVIFAFMTFLFFSRECNRVGTEGEPDLYYHLAISKMTAENGLIRQLPQAEDLGWGNKFPEKEFLFHAITGLTYKMGGESAVRELPLVFCLSIGLFLIFLASRFTNSLVAAGVVTTVLSATPLFVFRLDLLRPHLAAILFFVVAIWGLLDERRVVVFISALAYSLCYHAIYVLAVPAVVFAILPGDDQKERLKTSSIAFLGIVAGLFANPYFPSNIQMGLRHLQIALFESGGAITYGSELLPMPLEQFFTYYSFHVGVAAASVFFAFRRKTNLAIPVLTTIFVVLAIRSPRTLEYGVPLVSLSVAQLLSFFSRKQLIAFAAFAIVTLGIANEFYYRMRFQTQVEFTPQKMAERIREGVRAIPQKSKKVFTYEWQLGSYIIYDRPDLKFVDLLDPSFLKQTNPELFQLRQDLVNGSVPSSPAILRGKFNADSAITISSKIAERLKSMPGFKLVYEVPDPKFGNAWVFSVGKESSEPK